MRWRRSSYSGDTGNCVEVSSHDSERVTIRDSRNASGSVLVLDRTEWARFLTSIRTQPSTANVLSSQRDQGPIR